MNTRRASPRVLLHLGAWIALGLSLTGMSGGCSIVRPWQRGQLASAPMQFQMAPFAEGQAESVSEITEGGTFVSAGPGSAGAGCGCH